MTKTCPCCHQSLPVEKISIKSTVNCKGINNKNEYVWGFVFEALNKTFDTREQAELYIRSQGKEVYLGLGW